MEAAALTIPLLESTLDMRGAASRHWDVIVIGAGPAGALAARQLAGEGSRTLLVDKSSFPREKVCGCCINGAAIDALRVVGLEDLPSKLGAQPLDRWRLATAGRTVEHPLTAGVALSRGTLDAGLVKEAIRHGASFLMGTAATLKETGEATCQLRLSQGDCSVLASTQLAIGACGLNSNAFRQQANLRPIVQRHSRIGAGTMIPASGDEYRTRTIYMAYGREGYVGLVRLENGQLDVAGALNVKAVRNAGGPGALAVAIIEQSGLPVLSGMRGAAWRGTPALTRRPKRVYSDRVLLIGDAAGYIEPFTGEGIAWALWSALAVVPMACQGIQRWSPVIGKRWARAYGRTIARRQLICRTVARLLQHPAAAGAVATVLAVVPRLANPVVRYINTPPHSVIPDCNRPRPGIPRVSRGSH